MGFAWSILPILLYGGIALQGSAILLFGITIPILMLGINTKQRQLFLPIGLSCVLLWSVFPCANLINWFLSPSVATDLINWQKLFTSKVPTVVLVSGFLCLYLHFKAPVQKKSVDIDQSMKFMIRGFCGASLIMLGYGLMQYFWGFDYRYPGWQLPDFRLFSNSSYFRIHGLFAHPLTFASVCLGFFGFFSYLLYLSVQKKHYSFLGSNRAALFVIVLCQMILLFLSGGRTAALVGLSFLLLLVLLHFKTKLSLGLAIFPCLLVLSIASFFYLQFGLHQRVLEIYSQVQQGNIPFDRLYFWQVYWQMILDHPWIGAGAYFIKYGLRDFYYQQIGLELFEKKYNAHNIFLEVVASVGLIGSCIIGFTSYRFWYKLKGVCSQPKEKALLLASGFSILLNCIHGLTQNTFFDSPVVMAYAGLFWMVMWLMGQSDKEEVKVQLQHCHFG